MLALEGEWDNAINFIYLKDVGRNVTDIFRASGGEAPHVCSNLNLSSRTCFSQVEVRASLRIHPISRRTGKSLVTLLREGILHIAEGRKDG